MELLLSLMKVVSNTHFNKRLLLSVIVMDTFIFYLNINFLFLYRVQRELCQNQSHDRLKISSTKKKYKQNRNNNFVDCFFLFKTQILPSVSKKVINHFKN